MVAFMSENQQNSSFASTEGNSNSSQYTLPKQLFGTDGIRGKVGELLTPHLALNVGLAAGEVWQKLVVDSKVIIIGQDSRNSSDMLAMAIASGLTSMGFEVWNVGLCPTPCVAYLAKTTEALGAIMISASHNPPQDNGIKFFSGNGTKLDKSITNAIETTLRQYVAGEISLQEQKCGQVYNQHSLTRFYADFLQSAFQENTTFKGLKVVLDLAWGASVELAPKVFRALGAEVICLHDRADGDRINVNCGSTHLETLNKAVAEHNADMGYAFDGDADRVMAVDTKGRVVCGDYILYLWGKALKQQQLLPNNLLIGTVMANLGFELAWKKLGGELIRTSVGDQNVQASMWETGAMLGGEQSGHILCHHHHFSGDGLQTALQLTALVTQQGQDLASLVDDSFEPYPQILHNITVNDREKRLHWQESTAIQEAISLAQKDMSDQGRILVRASGTEPLIRVMVEAQNVDLVNHWTNYLVKAVQNNLG